MIKNRQYTRTFTCQLTMEMIHNKLNEAFVKEIGWSNKLALEKETRRVLPDELRGTIQGTTNRNTMFEPAFIIKKNADNIFEFSYFIRGIIDSKMNDQDNVPTIVKNSLNALVKEKIITNLSDPINKILDNKDLIDLGL